LLLLLLILFDIVAMAVKVYLEFNIP